MRTDLCFYRDNFFVLYMHYFTHMTVHKADEVLNNSVLYAAHKQRADYLYYSLE